MAATPAQSATGSECPDAFPVSGLAADQPVTGLTVTKGTEPGEFSGKVIGVLKDGIMPGLDMIMVRLGADTTGVDKRIHDVGIWAGMSGSPVYAEDGTLIGAVSYGLAFGPSTVAGVTPAEDMQELLDAGADPTARPAKRVDLPARMEDRIVASGAATESAAEDGMAQLKLPFGMAGVSQARFNKVTKRLDIPGVRMMRMGTTAAGALDETALVAGGNLAAAISYGDITYAGVGTATMVCGEDVVGFGHPMMWSGPTGLSLHPADALYVQEDPVFSGFKVANIGDPVGTIDQDRMAGIAGFFGALPATSTITSHVTSPTDERTGSSYVNLPDWVPDVALSHLLTNEDKVFDGIGKGSGTVSWVVTGKRQDGTPFTLTRSDVYASEFDLTWETAFDLYAALWQLEGNRTEDITIDTVNTDSDLSRDYTVATIEDVSVKQGGKWVSLRGLRKLGAAGRFDGDLQGRPAHDRCGRLERAARPARAEAGRRTAWLPRGRGRRLWPWLLLRRAQRSVRQGARADRERTAQRRRHRQLVPLPRGQGTAQRAAGGADVRRRAGDRSRRVRAASHRRLRTTSRTSNGAGGLRKATRPVARHKTDFE